MVPLRTRPWPKVKYVGTESHVRCASHENLGGFRLRQPGQGDDEKGGGEDDDQPAQAGCLQAMDDGDRHEEKCDDEPGHGEASKCLQDRGTEDEDVGIGRDGETASLHVVGCYISSKIVLAHVGW